jgi:hypothetical protein
VGVTCAEKLSAVDSQVEPETKLQVVMFERLWERLWLLVGVSEVKVGPSKSRRAIRAGAVAGLFCLIANRQWKWLLRIIWWSRVGGCVCFLELEANENAGASRDALR